MSENLLRSETGVKELLGIVDAPAEPVVEETPVEPTEDVPAEPSDESNPTEEPVVASEPVVEETPAEPNPEPYKAKVEYKDWLDQHKEDIKRYIDETSTDYSQLSPEELVKQKLQRDNPDWTPEEISDELKDRYGIGLTKKEINEDEMTDAEIAEVKRYNEEVDRLLSKGSRTLKAEAKDALEFLNKQKEELSLPELEWDAPKPEEIDYNKLNEDLIRMNTEYREKEVLPKFKEAVSGFESVKASVEYDDNGNKVVLDVNYKLSEAEKEKLADYLSGYAGNEKDAERYIVNGEVQYSKIVADEAARLLQANLLKTVAKEAAAKARAEFVKNELVNYDETPRNQAPAAAPSEYQSLLDRVWKGEQ